ncbi:MAG TPA: MGMT family protein [Candidatus Aminicenantes bacterium]|nr:MGMT family protein [Candidatus Aminicenantes bacterium]HRY64644.1 MGMT family protein [Candidatus Aminicenantes bacterium]HRZ71557.1 MGMT family protein [Candidatus Aminicenantes bacterium]
MDKRSETPFTREVKAVIRAIPGGRVATYGQIAALAGRDGAARGVAWILHSSSEAAGLPWHRVIGGRGAISLPRGRGFEEQRERLTAEGVTVGPGGRVDLERYGWEPAAGAAGRSRAARKFLRELLRS